MLWVILSDYNFFEPVWKQTKNDAKLSSALLDLLKRVPLIFAYETDIIKKWLSRADNTLLLSVIQDII